MTARLRGRWKGIALGASVIGAIVIAAILLLSVSSPNVAAGIVTYCGGEGTAAHYHILLVIEDKGIQQPLPYQPGSAGDIGYINQPGYTNSQYYCSSGIHALHTHDGSGIIHAEIPAVISLNPPPTLANFFQIWGEPLTTTSVWTFSGTATAQVVFEGGPQEHADYSSNPGSIPLSVPSGGPLSNPYTIPQNWIFSGAYGDGSSQGAFGGEIIWLNVTA